MTPEGVDAVASFLQYGVLGLFTLALIMGWVVPKPVNDRERARADRLEQENGALRDRLETEIIPLLTKAVLAIERLSGEQPRRD